MNVTQEAEKHMISLDQFFRDRGHCIDAMHEARELFGLTTTTRKQYDAMERVLAFVYVYCPEDLHIAALSILTESERRRMWYETNVWEDEDSEQC